MYVTLPQKGFKCANASYLPLCSTQLSLYNPPGVPILMGTLEAVAADVPGLRGLDVLDTPQITVDTAFNLIGKRTRMVIMILVWFM